ncbi:hypothetical protein B296_00055569, partial [Ensete ventricosum]
VARTNEEEGERSAGGRGEVESSVLTVAERSARGRGVGERATESSVATEVGEHSAGGREEGKEQRWSLAMVAVRLRAMSCYGEVTEHRRGDMEIVSD